MSGKVSDKGRVMVLQTLMQGLPTTLLIYHLNYLLKMLEKDRGVVVRDWEHKDRTMRYIRSLGGRYYFMASKDPKEGNEHGHKNPE